MAHIEVFNQAGGSKIRTYAKLRWANGHRMLGSIDPTQPCFLLIAALEKASDLDIDELKHLIQANKGWFNFFDQNKKRGKKKRY